MPGINGITGAIATVVAIGVGILAWRLAHWRKSATSTSPTFLGDGSAQKDFVALKFKEKIVVTHDVRIFRFALPSPDQSLGLPVGQHISLKCAVDGKDVVRTYTPVSTEKDKGFFDLLVKVYFADVHPKFPRGGKMSQHLENLKPGESILMKGPTGKFFYLGGGQYKIKVGADSFKTGRARSIGMIAGGSGITPMLQIIHAVAGESDAERQPSLTLILSNHTAEDMLCLRELQAFEQTSKLKLFCTVTRPQEKPGEKWTGLTGRVNADMLAKCFGGPGKTDVCFMCGPSGLVQETCMPLLKAAGFSDDQLIAF